MFNSYLGSYHHGALQIQPDYHLSFDLQCCVNYCCTASDLVIHTHMRALQNFVIFYQTST